MLFLRVNALFLRVNAHTVSSTWCVHGCDIVLRYERAYIVEWLQKHDTSPATGDNCGGVCRCDARHQRYMLLMFTLIRLRDAVPLFAVIFVDAFDVGGKLESKRVVPNHALRYVNPFHKHELSQPQT